MHSDQYTYRQLCGALQEYNGTSAYRDLLQPWLEDNPKEVEWLADFGRRSGSPIPSASVEDLWRLYALGRVVEQLIMRFQDPAGSNWAGPPIAPQDFTDFASQLGLSIARPTVFSSFDHEIVQVEHVVGFRRIEVVEYLWPRLMLGPMLVCRAGVRVRATQDKANKSIAETSTLYWAYRRTQRPHQDLSHGWGSNSSWRTSFRRDYKFTDTIHFNVDGTSNLQRTGPPTDREILKIEQGDGLDTHERIELLTNRCLLTTSKNHEDLWPYDDHYQMPVPL